VDVESRQGKAAKTDGLMINDCDTVTTTAISDKKKCQTTRNVYSISVSLSSSEQDDEPNVVKEGEEESRWIKQSIMFDRKVLSLPPQVLRPI
jgi:hypothetical protein